MQPKESIAAVQQVFALLEALALAGQASTAELGRQVCISQAATQRLLQTLAALGHVQQHRDGWRLAVPLFELGARALQTPELLDVAKPVMRELAESSGEAVQLGFLAEDEIICLHKIEAHHSTGLSMPVGHPIPIQGSAMGRALMAWRAAWAPFASRGELARIRAEGFCEQREANVYSVAAPIFDHTSDAIAGLAIHVPHTRFDEASVPGLIAQVRSAAGTISEGFGCTATPVRPVMPPDGPIVAFPAINGRTSQGLVDRIGLEPMTKGL